MTNPNTQDTEVRTAFARASHVRVTPMKARRVIDLIRDMPAQEALSVLKFAPTRTFKGHVRDDRRARRG